MPDNSLLKSCSLFIQMTLKENTQVKERYAKEHVTLIDINCTEKQETTNSPQKVNEHNHTLI